MKIHKKLSFILIFLIVSTIILSSSLPATRTIGIGPSVINFGDVYRYGEYQRTLYVYNGNEYETNFTLLVSGDFYQWVTFYESLDAPDPITFIIIPPETTTPVIMKVTIPDDASNGKYKGKVYTEFYPTDDTEENTTSAGVIIRLPAIVNLNVSGIQNLNATVSRVNFIETEINYLLPIGIDIKNTGNVVATPSVNINISKGGLFVDRYTGTLLPVQPGQTRYNTIYWNTSGNIPGIYDANVTISLEKNIIHQNDYSFELLAPGTLTRNGTLNKITISGNQAHQGIIKIEATFVNTGQIETKAKFFGEIYRDGTLVETIESVELEVPRFSEEVLTTYYRFGVESGTYEIKGYVLYEGKQTNIQSVTIPIGSATFASILPYIGVVVIVTSILIFTLLFIRKKKTTIPVSTPIAKKKTPPMKTIQRATKKSQTKVTSSMKKTQKKQPMKRKKNNETSAGDIERFLDSVEAPGLSMSKTKKKLLKNNR